VKIQEVLRSKSRKIHDPAGRETMILEDKDALKTASRFGLATPDVYREALRIGICPYRYLRNRETISGEEQFRLCTSCVAVVGAGGLGGHVILLLARVGIGHLVVVDNDRFDETNLNRQALSSGQALGRWKAEETVRVVGDINPGVRVTAHHVRIDPSNAGEMLHGSDVIVDALDNIPDRFVLEGAARSLGIPLVHGALAGLEGQVMTIFPEDTGLKRLYGRREPDGEGSGSDSSQGPEAVLGVPALTPALIGALQATEVIKIILKRGKLFRNLMIHVDLETGEIGPFTFGETD
jgi:molybdopterin/thiamine biosynthesis adenylyltransferase